MELSLNLKKKAALQKAIAYEKKSIRVMIAISKWLLIIGLVGGGLYALVNALMPTLCIVRVNGVEQKNISWLVISTSLIVLPCSIISVCLKTLANNLASVNNSARVDENLLVSGETLRYSFRIKHQTTSSERYVIVIPISQICQVNFNEKAEALEFVGAFSSEYFSDYREETPDDTTAIDKFVIYDYFTPSLKETLRAKGVMINH